MPTQHAKAYPFFIPDTSYVLDQNGWRPFSGSAPVEKLHGVIASGSNASPDRLEAKFEGHAELLTSPIYVLRAKLHGFESVYSAHFTSYGSIPATLAPAAGSITDVFVTWLDDAQLERMHETENVGVNYDYAHLPDIKLVMETGTVENAASAYLSKRGILRQNGHPISLRTMCQEQVLAYAKSIVAPHIEGLDDFILALIDDKEVREKFTQLLG